MKLICHLYILIWLVYNIHWFCAGSFPIVDAYSNQLLAVNLFVSAVCVVVCLIKHSLPKLLKVVNVMVLMFVIYGLISILTNDTIIIAFTGARIKNGTYMVAALRSFLPIYTFYLFTKLGVVTERMLKSWFFIFIAEIIWAYMLNRYSMNFYTFEDIFTNNSAYYFVGIVPFLALFKARPIFQYVIIAICAFYVVLGAKRGAIIIFACELIFLYSTQMASRNSRKKTYGTIAIVSIMLFSYSYAQTLFEQSDKFQERVMSTMGGEDSGRLNIITQLLRGFVQQANILQLLFGFGADGTLKIGVNYAHNDWVEMLIDQGVLGVAVFAFFWYFFYKTWKASKGNEMIYCMLGLLFISGILKTLFSMWYSVLDVFVTFPLGYSLAIIQKDRMKKLIIVSREK